MAGLGYCAVGATSVVVLGASAPVDAEWSALVEWLAKQAMRGPVPRVLLSSHGGSPAAHQRKALVERVLVGRKHRIAFVTGSREVRGAAAAISWMCEQPIECFLPHEAGLALAYLEAADDRAAILAEAAKMEALMRVPARLLETAPATGPVRYVPES